MPVTLFIQIVAFLEPLDSTSGIHQFSFTGEEGMSFAAQLNVQCLLGGTGSESVAAGTDYLGIRIKFGMNFVFHSIIAQRKR